MWQLLVNHYVFLRKRISFYFDLFTKKGRDLSFKLHNSIVKWVYSSLLVDNKRSYSNYFVNKLANALGKKELDKYLKVLKPPLPLLTYDNAIKSMKIEWNSSLLSIYGKGENADIKGELEEEIINKYVRYVSRHIFVLLPPNNHKILLNATLCEPLGHYQIPIGEQVVYKDPQELEDYLVGHLMGVLVSYQENAIENFMFFISNVDEEQVEELSRKITALLK